MKVLICGSRSFKDSEYLNWHLNMIHSASPITHVVVGKENGVEALAAAWAEKNKIDHSVYPKIINDTFDFEKPINCCIAFPTNSKSNTWTIKQLSEKNGVPVMEVPYLSDKRPVVDLPRGRF